MATATASNDNAKKKHEHETDQKKTTAPTPDVTKIRDDDDDKTTDAQWKRVRTIRVPEFGPDADRAVRSLQNARKERARVKTSVNVQRALYGNMLICVAKLGAWVSSGSSSMMAEFV